MPKIEGLLNQAGVLMYALVFGYAQQLFTRLVDQRAERLVEAAGTAKQEAPA